MWIKSSGGRNRVTHLWVFVLWRKQPSSEAAIDFCQMWFLSREVTLKCICFIYLLHVTTKADGCRCRLISGLVFEAKSWFQDLQGLKPSESHLGADYQSEGSVTPNWLKRRADYKSKFCNSVLGFCRSVLVTRPWLCYLKAVTFN